MKINYFKLITSIVICQLAGIIGAFFTTPYIKTWYAGLNKPSFNPPNWIFGPVWTTLFVLMGIALYLVWTNDKNTIQARKIFALQLALNVLWSYLFFAMQRPGFAFFEIIFLWVAILYTIISFYKISKWAGYLLVPYILWVSFAAFLNFSIWIINA